MTTEMLITAVLVGVGVVVSGAGLRAGSRDGTLDDPTTGPLLINAFVVLPALLVVVVVLSALANHFGW
jgi:hypothetical protein